jgi:hypothetical protein
MNGSLRDSGCNLSVAARIYPNATLDIDLVGTVRNDEQYCTDVFP